ncbi:glycine-rich domain-containing protein [Oceanobacter mangrovi]|uniref:glycine-rich domain-containing protein n=1 Tax=Oceanobacter mangrovi TaxID=2862510 RepID=UPI001C8D575F|nr:hypothetical protein [Oceanobacter mangrovi]
MNYVVLAAGVVPVWWLWRRLQRRQRARFIEDFRFHPSISRKVQQRYPHLDDDQLALVMDGLRDYFWCCSTAGRKSLAMPSQVVDVAWHEFILFTRAYQTFCKQAFGRFLHHTPTEAMANPTKAQLGIRRVWRLACARQGLSARLPLELPRLFALDTQLKISDGYVYSLNCKDKNSRNPLGDSYCASHIGCSSGCSGDFGGDSGGGIFGDSDHSGHDGGGSSCSGCSGGGD